ncbi:hypothetical protein GCM10025857_35660 [Alicyclobacillus contaminans]|uniref:polysaccharide biosynthesis C-terminal domain-containing protein n=1 Tax=Alicyclobacillus contaminans TaxID=392016 RepID=UPI00040235CE|nr:polysaccharide biosynthesis C-terminal domain-containing protein [Alicyclobacillus contaminans]GMA52209.1 hypothetical protein GCM10025857_35660 [Alicyclobacillus contaminans]
MNTAFPVQASAVYSLSELISRALGLWFLARFVDFYGLGSSGLLRTVLPVLGVASALGTVGIPQAVTRLLSSTGRQTSRAIPHGLARACAWTAGFAALSSVLFLFVTVGLAHPLQLDNPDVVQLLLLSVPLLVMNSLSATIKAALLGLGMNMPPALAQTLEIATRVALLFFVTQTPGPHQDLTGAEMGMFLLTASELFELLFLVSTLLFLRLAGRLKTGPRGEPEQRHRALYLSVLRMALSPTLQSLLASAGYAVELPLAEHYLALQYGSHQAEVMIAEYAAVALPLLCAPMFVTDGMATALLPTLTHQRVEQGREVLGHALRSTVRVVAMIAIPASAALYVLAPDLCRWFGATGAAPLLAWLAPIAFPLYLQAPLGAALQAQGQSRGLLYSGLVADVLRLLSLWWCLGVWHLAVAGILITCALAVLAQTAILLHMTIRTSPFAFPYTTVCQAFLCGVVVCAMCMTARRVPDHLRFDHHPVLWATFMVMAGTTYLLVAGELTPAAFGRLPVVGRPLRRAAEAHVRRMLG